MGKLLRIVFICISGIFAINLGNMVVISKSITSTATLLLPVYFYLFGLITEFAGYKTARHMVIELLLFILPLLLCFNFSVGLIISLGIIIGFCWLLIYGFYATVCIKATGNFTFRLTSCFMISSVISIVSCNMLVLPGQYNNMFSVTVTQIIFAMSWSIFCGFNYCIIRGVLFRLQFMKKAKLADNSLFDIFDKN